VGSESAPNTRFNLVSVFIANRLYSRLAMCQDARPDGEPAEARIQRGMNARGPRYARAFMTPSLVLIGIGKMLFGIVVGAAGVFSASRLLRRMLRWGDGDEELEKGNSAAAVLEAAALVAFGLLVQHAVSSTFSAMDLMYRGHDLAAPMLLRFAIYGLAHAGISLLVGTFALAAGAWLFGRLTRGVDELAEVRKGNLAPALVLGAVMVVMALVTAPGLQTALDGMLPLPKLDRDELQAPA
jgi:uncharacterized membrane protein YjfL (UPF0719 family)